MFFQLGRFNVGQIKNFARSGSRVFREIWVSDFARLGARIWLTMRAKWVYRRRFGKEALPCQNHRIVRCGSC
jgi:hypothetical protein